MAMTGAADARCEVCGLRGFAGDPVLAVSDGKRWGRAHRACLDQWSESGERCVWPDPRELKRALYGDER